MSTARRALAPARLAGHAELHGLGHGVRGDHVLACVAASIWPGQSRAAGCWPAPAPRRARCFVTRIGGAHDARIERPSAGAVVVAHLDRALQAAAGARHSLASRNTVSNSGPPRNPACIPKQSARSSIFGAIDDLAGVERAPRDRTSRFTSPNARDHAGAEHRLVKFGAHDPVAMFARYASPCTRAPSRRSPPRWRAASLTPTSCLRLRTGRTCSVPTEACA